MTQLILTFSVSSQLPLVQMDSSTHVHGPTVHMKEELTFAQDYHWKTLQILTCFRLALLQSVSYSFLFYQSPSLILCVVFDYISSIDEVLSINPSTDVVVFEDFDVHHKDLLTYSGGTDISGELYSNYSISDDLIQMVNFPTPIPDNNSHSPALLDLFLSSDASICSIMPFPPFGNSDHVVDSVSIAFPLHSQQDALFHCIAYDYYCANWDGLHDHLRDVPWENVTAAAHEFCKWVQVGTDVYIPHQKYQVRPHSSPWFSAAYATAIVYRNHFFRLHQNDKSESKRKFRQTSNHCKRILEAAKFAYDNKTRVHHFPETWLLGLLANCQ